MGIELPAKVSEQEDEFKAKFDIVYGESIKHEFSRVLGKIEAKTGKPAEFLKPDIMIILNPFTSHIKLQVNPLLSQVVTGNLLATSLSPSGFVLIVAAKVAKHVVEQVNSTKNQSKNWSPPQF